MEENELIPVDNNNTVEYTDDNIRHLSDMEHVRTRLRHLDLGPVG